MRRTNFRIFDAVAVGKGAKIFATSTACDFEEEIDCLSVLVKTRWKTHFLCLGR